MLLILYIDIIDTMLLIFSYNQFIETTGFIISLLLLM